MENPKVSIIILNYNGASFLKNCLLSVEKQTYPNIETIVIDNNSSDESYKLVEGLSQVKLIRLDENFGYAKANNLAVSKATGELVLFLNNDTELFSDMVEKLVESYQEKSIICPAQILMVNRGNDNIGSTGNGMDIFGYPYVDVDSRKTKLFYVDGAAIFISKKDFIDIGMFDEKLFMFQEDIDLSWRAQLMGYKLIQCWDAKFYHFSGGAATGGGLKSKQYETSYFRRYMNEKNIIRNILKNYSILMVLIILPILIFGHFLEIVILSAMFKWKVVGCYFKAYNWNIVNLADTFRYRKGVQKNRVVSDFYLLHRMYFAYSKFTSLVRVGIPKFK